MTDLYRLTFETVSPSIAVQMDQRLMSFDDLVETDWHVVSKETTEPWHQYNTLKAWAESREQPIRNVKLEKASNSIIWEEVSS